MAICLPIAIIMLRVCSRLKNDDCVQSASSTFFLQMNPSHARVCVVTSFLATGRPAGRSRKRCRPTSRAVLSFLPLPAHLLRVPANKTQCGRSVGRSCSGHPSVRPPARRSFSRSLLPRSADRPTGQQVGLRPIGLGLTRALGVPNTAFRTRSIY